MSKIQVRLNELKFELHGKHSELRRAEQQYYSSEEDIRYSEENLQSQLEVEKEEYIEQIKKLLPNCNDISLLDLIYQLLKKHSAQS